MKYIYAALLLHSAGKKVSKSNLTKVVKAVGLEVDVAQVKSLTAAFSEVNIDEVLESISAVQKAVPAPPTTTPPTEEKPPAKKEEEEKEEAEEESFEGLGGLFG